MITLLLVISGNTKAQNNMLDNKQERIVTISSFAARGELEKLKLELVAGLEAGLTVNEIKEILVHRMPTQVSPEACVDRKLLWPCSMNAKQTTSTITGRAKHYLLPTHVINTNGVKKYFPNYSALPRPKAVPQ